MKSLEEELNNLLNKPEWTQADRQQLLELLENMDAVSVQDILTAHPLQNENIDRARSMIMLQQIHANTGMQEKAPVKKMWSARLTAAAAILAFVIGGFWLMMNKKGREINPVSTASVQQEILPGGNKAVLTLSDGTRIILDSANNGAISNQGNVTVIKLNDGRLAYQPSKGAVVSYNTITTPRGGQYQVVLADGTKVWLNAQSSLRFPTAFTGAERKVELAGEGYFEVAPNKQKPFFVKVGTMQVKVLGTHFSVNAYKDQDNVQTTLFEGSVNVESGNQHILLTPGKQAVVNSQTKKIAINDNVDTEEVLAWKNGKFYFNNANIESIMKEVSRWYDADVEFTGTINKVFAGTIPRDVSAETFFDILEATGGVHFKIEGKKVIVSPNKTGK